MAVHQTIGNDILTEGGLPWFNGFRVEDHQHKRKEATMISKDVNERTEYFEYLAIDLQTNEVLTCEESLSPILGRIRKNIKIQHGNKIRAELLEHGVVYVNGYGRRDDNRNEYYSWKLYVQRW
jgi:hypothetical protein